MTIYVLKRLLTGVVLAVLVTFITFWLLSLSFDNIVSNILGAATTPEASAALSAEYGFDDPVIVQYMNWLGGAVQGDFGRSFFNGQEVVQAVSTRLSVTMSIIVVALSITAVVSVLLGVVAATRGGIVDRLLQGVSLIGYVVPSLLLAIILVVVLAVGLGWLPATGYTPFAADPVQWLRSIVIPVIVLVMTGVAGMAAQVRGAMIDELRKDYVRTLRTRGISNNSIVIRHALRNAAGPALTVLSLEFIGMFGGALIIENVFALPGFGSYAFNAALQGDVPIIMGVTAFSVLLVVAVNVTVDVLNGWLNPKARVH